jgi:Family of unknown function (DUF5763)
MERARCKASRKDGSPCAAPALEQDGYCFAHSPRREQERAQARSKGGRNKSNIVRLRNMAPARLLPIYDRLEEALAQVHDGSLQPAQAQAMAALARALAAILQAGELEERLRALEQNAGLTIQPKNWRVR